MTLLFGRHIAKWLPNYKLTWHIFKYWKTHPKEQSHWIWSLYHYLKCQNSNGKLLFGRHLGNHQLTNWCGHTSNITKHTLRNNLTNFGACITICTIVPLSALLCDTNGLKTPDVEFRGLSEIAFQDRWTLDNYQPLKWSWQDSRVDRGLAKPYKWL